MAWGFKDYKAVKNAVVPSRRLDPSWGDNTNIPEKYHAVIFLLWVGVGILIENEEGCRLLSRGKKRRAGMAAKGQSSRWELGQKSSIKGFLRTSF